MAAPALDLHIHLPAGLTGTVHVHVNIDGSSHLLQAAASAEAAASAAVPAPAPAPAQGSGEPDRPAGDAPDDDEVQEMLRRFERYDADTAARTVYETLLSRGWRPFLPKARGGKTKSAAAYIRLVYRGSSRRVTLYLNSSALVSAGTSEREFATSLPGADVQSEDVYLHHSDNRAGQAVDAAEALQRWADGAHQSPST